MPSSRLAASQSGEGKEHSQSTCMGRGSPYSNVEEASKDSVRGWLLWGGGEETGAVSVVVPEEKLLMFIKLLLAWSPYHKARQSGKTKVRFGPRHGPWGEPKEGKAGREQLRPSLKSVPVAV